jgi:hypothetical protein
MGRNGRNADAPIIENMFPKFELNPILMYFKVFWNVLRPSYTPSFKTERLLSRRMMSAVGHEDVQAGIDAIAREGGDRRQRHEI